MLHPAKGEACYTLPPLAMSWQSCYCTCKYNTILDIKKCNIREKRKIVMQNNATPAPTQATGSLGSIALLRLLIARHPYTSALFFLVYWLALLLALGRVLSPIYLATH